MSVLLLASNVLTGLTSHWDSVSAPLICGAGALESMDRGGKFRGPGQVPFSFSVLKPSSLPSAGPAPTSTRSPSWISVA